MSEKDVVEIPFQGYPTIPIASNSAKGIASFDAKDFAVNNGEVSAIWGRGLPQYIGNIVGQEEGEGDLTWTIDKTTIIENRPVQIGEYVMLNGTYGDFVQGDIFVITGVNIDGENFTVTTDNQKVLSFAIKGNPGAGWNTLEKVDLTKENVVATATDDGINIDATGEVVAAGESHSTEIVFNIPIKAGGGVKITGGGKDTPATVAADLLQTSGQSETQAMSQKAVTEAIAEERATASAEVKAEETRAKAEENKLAEEISKKIGNLNIENGDGEGSLQQKYVKDGIDYSANAAGENAVAFGGKRFDKLSDANRTATSAEGNQSFASGGSTHSYGDFSAAFGKDTIARQRASFAAGSSTAGMTEEEFNAFFWDNINNVGIHGGSKNTAGQICDFTGAPYEKSFAFAMALGCECEATGPRSFATGDNAKAQSTGATATGTRTIASGVNSTATGADTVASEDCSFAANQGTKATGYNSSAFGLNTKAEGNHSIAFGEETQTTAPGAIAEGYKTKASGEHSHAGGGQYTEAVGFNSFAFGANVHANAENSAAFGYETVVNSDNGFAVGKNNVMRRDVYFQVGNGTNWDVRSDAFVVLKDGRAKVQTAPTEDTDVLRKTDVNEVYEISSTVYSALDMLATAAISASPKALRIPYAKVNTGIIAPPSALNYGTCYYILRVLAKPSSGAGVIEVTFENVSTSTKGIRPIGYIRQGIGGTTSTWWWSGWTSETFVDLTSEQTISGIKTFSNYIKTPQVANASGKGLVRYKDTEVKSVFGNDSSAAVLMGNTDRPYYSKSGSDFTGAALALLSDITGGGNLYLHTLNFIAYGVSGLNAAGAITVTIERYSSASTPATSDDFYNLFPSNKPVVGTSYTSVGNVICVMRCTPKVTTSSGTEYPGKIQEADIYFTSTTPTGSTVDNSGLIKGVDLVKITEAEYAYPIRFQNDIVTEL